MNGQTAFQFAVARGIGLLIGIERKCHKGGATAMHCH